MNGTLNFDKYISIVNSLKSTLYLCIEEQSMDLHEVNLEERDKIQIHSCIDKRVILLVFLLFLRLHNV